MTISAATHCFQVSPVSFLFLAPSSALFVHFAKNIFNSVNGNFQERAAGIMFLSILSKSTLSNCTKNQTTAGTMQLYQRKIALFCERAK